MNLYIQITIATILGGISGGIVSFFAKLYFAEKIKAAIKAEYDDKLEKLKSDLKKNEIAITSALTSQNQGYQIGQKEVLDAIKTFWENYLLIREAVSALAFTDSYLLENEFETLFTEKWQGNNVLPEQMLSIDFNSKLKATSDAIVIVEKSRPFLSSNLWLYISFYQLFCGRILYLYSQGVLKRKMSHWKKDSALLNAIKDIFSEKEYKLVMSNNYGSTKAVTSLLEEKILLEFSKTLSGHIAAENTYNQAIRLLELDKRSKS
jgi:hypothetical protein